MEDEAADIELLEQHLNKTSQISQRMTATLSKFDARLVKLEKSILPLHKSTQTLSRRADNIDSTLLTMKKVATNQENAASEEALILRGPQPGHLADYTAVIDRLNANFAFASDRMPKDAARLVEAGAKKLTQLYTKMVAEASSGNATPAPDLAPPPFPPALLTSLAPLVATLRSLPLPATHPSHPAAQGVHATLKEAQKGYADMRGAWCRKCLEAPSRRVVERVETMQGVEGGREFARWIEAILNHAQAEHILLVALAPMAGPVQGTFDELIQSLLPLFQSSLSALSTLIKRALHKYAFLALSTYSSLSTLQPRWDDVMCKRAGRRDNELKEGLHSLRGVCLRSFPEFLADIKLLGTRPPENQAVGSGVAEVTINTVQYLKNIPQAQDAVASFLMTLGDGNWKMGDGVGKGGKLGGSADTEEQTLLEHYIHDVIVTLVGTVSSISKTGRRPQMSAIYLLNNVSYLRTRLLGVDASESSIDELISIPTQDVLNSNFRTAKAAYFDSNFSPLIQALTDDKERSGGLVVSGKSAAMKEKWSRFFDALDEIAERHRVSRVMADDPDGRNMLEEEVVRLVIPALARFTQKNKEKEFTKHPEKYIKATPEEVEQQIRNFFR